jgi:hypothetical protein
MASLKTASFTALACLAALVLVPGKAAAVGCVPPGTVPPGAPAAVPAGTSALDQYFETIPAASCKCGSAKSGGLSRSEVRQLTSEGAAGRAVIRSVSSYAPPSPRARGTNVRPASGESPIGALGRLMLTGSSTSTGATAVRSRCQNSTGSATGTGPLLPIVLGLALVGAVATVLVRRWRAHPSPA